MPILANPVAGYVGTVFGVIAIASIAVYDLHGVAAKAHRHWDADIDRIIAQQQDKKRYMDMTALARTETPDGESGVEPQFTALSTGSIEAEETASANSENGPPNVRGQGGRKYSPRAERQRQQHYIPKAFVTLPKFAATAAATTTTTLLRLR